MSANATVESIVNVDGGAFTDLISELTALLKIKNNIRLHYFPCLIFIGVPCSILVLTILIRHRLWIRHEAYIYLAAILIINSYKLIFIYGNSWLGLLDHKLPRLLNTADVICKFWIWLEMMADHVDWVYVLMLFNVHLRQKLITSRDRRGFYVNLAAKCCSLFGAKVIVSSFFAVCALSTFWVFAMTSLQISGKSWYCSAVTVRYFQQHLLLMGIRLWFKVDIPLLIILVQLLLIILKTKRSSCFVFTQMNGSSQDNKDAEGMTRLVVCCVVTNLINSAPEFLIHVLYLSDLQHHISWQTQEKLYDALYLMYLTFPLSTPIVCLAVKSRFRDELKTMVQRCCCQCYPGSRCHRTLPIEPDNNRSSVLQMDPIDVDSTIENDSVPATYQT